LERFKKTGIHYALVQMNMVFSRSHNVEWYFEALVETLLILIKKSLNWKRRWNLVGRRTLFTWLSYLFWLRRINKWLRCDYGQRINNDGTFTYTKKQGEKLTWHKFELKS
jgi:hypothetical protein